MLLAGAAGHMNSADVSLTNPSSLRTTLTNTSSNLASSLGANTNSDLMTSSGKKRKLKGEIHKKAKGFIQMRVLADRPFDLSDPRMTVSKYRFYVWL